MSKKQTYLYIGAELAGAQVDVCRYDMVSGTLERVGVCLEGVQVGSMRIDPKRLVFYCSHHVKNYPGFEPGGGGQFVSAKIDPATGLLTELNRQPSYGTMPVMMELDPAAEFLMATNHSQYTPIMKVTRSMDGSYHIHKEYDDAPTVLYPIHPDGTIDNACDMLIHGGCTAETSYPNPHPHCVVRSPLWELYVVCDKGADRIYMFKIDRDRRRLTLATTTEVPSGMAPRYAAYHPVLPFLFTNNEKQPIVFSFRYNESGALEHLRSVETLPEGFDMGDVEEPMPSDLKIHPNGKYLYTLIRRLDTVSVLAIDENTGALTRKQTLKLPGKEAKACVLSPDGRFLFVTAKKDHRVYRYDIAEDGTLTLSDYSFDTLAPDCMSFLQMEA